MRFDVNSEKTPRLVKFSQSTTNEIPSQVDPFCFVLTISDKHNTLSKQGLAFECYIHHLKTTTFVRQIAHLTLDSLISFLDHRKSKMIRLILFSAQAGRRMTDPVYHKPDNAKVLIIMDFPFRKRVRNFHDSDLLASFSIRKFQLRLRKSQLDIIKWRTDFIRVLGIFFMLTGLSVLPAIEPNHMPSVLSKFNLDPEPFSNIRTISKGLSDGIHQPRLDFHRPQTGLILDSSDEPGRRTLISLQFLIAAPAPPQPGYITGRKGSQLSGPTTYLKERGHKT